MRYHEQEEDPEGDHVQGDDHDQQPGGSQGVLPSPAEGRDGGGFGHASGHGHMVSSSTSWISVVLPWPVSWLTGRRARPCLPGRETSGNAWGGNFPITVARAAPD